MPGSFQSVRWNACVYRLDLGLYSHPKEFLGNGVRSHVNSKGKIPSTGEKKYPQRRMEPTTLHQAGQRARHTTNELFRPPCTSDLTLVLKWLPRQAPGVVESEVGLVGSVSACCDWVR